MILDDVLVIKTCHLSFLGSVLLFLALSVSCGVLRICIPAGQTYYADFVLIPSFQ